MTRWRRHQAPDDDRVAELERQRDQYAKTITALEEHLNVTQARCAAAEADRDSWRDAAQRGAAHMEALTLRIQALQHGDDPA